MHTPSTPAQAPFPCSVQAFSCYSTRRTRWQVGGWEWRGGVQGWACTHRAREKPGLAKRNLGPVFALYSSAKLSNWVGFSPHQGGLGDSPTAQACLCSNSLGSSGKFFSPITVCTAPRGVPFHQRVARPLEHTRCSLEPCLSVT